MPTGDNSAEPPKKRSQKKKHRKNRSKSKPHGTDKKDSKNSIKSAQNGSIFLIFLYGQCEKCNFYFL